jgi:hypothetical protein
MSRYNFSRAELKQYPTIEQSHSGDYLKIEEDNIRVWLTHPENTAYDGDYQVELCVDGKWICESFYEND